jgi:hypothetical protein
MTAAEVFSQNDGDVTKRYYADLGARGILGKTAVALFRAQKRSSRAKDYRRGRFRRQAYDVKQWSIDQLCELLTKYGAELGFAWGWKEDPKVPFGDRPSQVIYVEIPVFGQCSFHSPDRGDGPDYPGEWDGEHRSAERILAFCDAVMGMSTAERYAHLDGVVERTRGDIVNVPAHTLMSNVIPPEAAPPWRFGDPASIARARGGRRARR